MTSGRRALFFNAVMILLAAAPATAQFSEVERTLWGVGASIIPPGLPKWQTPHGLRAYFLADEISLKGSEFQVGVVRGSLFGGESGWSFVRQVLDKGSYVRDSTTGGGSLRLEVEGDAMLDGFLYHRYTPFTTIRERIQVGMVISGGAGWYRGTVSRKRTEDGRETTDEVNANYISGLARETDGSAIPTPLFRFEGAVAGLLGGGFRVRFSGGYGVPNGRVFRVGVVYFFGS